MTTALGDTAGSQFTLLGEIGFVVSATPAVVPDTLVATSGFIAGLLGDSELVLVHVVSTPFTLKLGLATSNAYAQTPPTAAAIIDIQKNDVSIGTIDFAMSANVATFTFTTDTAFIAGDRLQFVGQATADTTLADVSLTINGEL